MENGHLGFLEGILALMDKYGLWKITQATMILVAFFYIMYNVQNLPEIVSHAFSEQTEIRQSEHDAAVETRRAIKPDIDYMLKETLSALNADRAFIIEMHNGTNNVAGLPFIYGEMTYEKVRDGIVHIDEDYTSVNLSRFLFPTYLEQNHLWYGTLDALEGVDSKLATRMRANDVNYLAIVSLHGVSNLLGYFGFTFCGDKVPSDEKAVSRMLTVTAQKLSILLDINNNDEF